MKRTHLPLLLTLALAPPAAADIATTAYTMPFTPTAVNETLPLQPFDESLGQLQSAFVCVNGVVERRLGAENTGAMGGPITFSEIRETFRLALPGDDPAINPLVVINDILMPFTTPLGAYDGVTDFAGTSGFDTGVVRSSKIAEVLITDPAELDRFTGPGPLDFTLHADGTTAVEGPANMQAVSQAAVAVRVVVVYEYRPISG